MLLLRIYYAYDISRKNAKSMTWHVISRSISKNRTPRIIIFFSESDPVFRVINQQHIA